MSLVSFRILRGFTSVPCGRARRFSPRSEWMITSPIEIHRFFPSRRGDAMPARMAGTWSIDYGVCDEEAPVVVIGVDEPACDVAKLLRTETWYASFLLDTQKPFPYTPRVENQYLTGTILHYRRRTWRSMSAGRDCIRQRRKDEKRS
jgi:hypothetical protein